MKKKIVCLLAVLAGSVMLNGISAYASDVNFINDETAFVYDAEASDYGYMDLNAEIESEYRDMPLVKLTEDVTIDGNLVIDESIELETEGKNLTVNGDLIIKNSGELNINEASVITVKGNLVVEGENNSAISCDIRLGDQAVVDISGDLTWNSSGEFMSSIGGYDTEVAVNLKGTFTDKRGSNFKAQLNMCGDGVQKLDIKESSHINRLKASCEKIDAPIFNAREAVSDLVITNSAESKLVKITSAANWYETSCDMEANNHKITIDGNLELCDGLIFNLADSILDVKGDFVAGNDKVTNVNLYVNSGTVINVDGDFTWNSDNDVMKPYVGTSTEAILNLKGTYTDKAGKRFLSKLNMCGSDLQKLILKDESVIRAIQTGSNRIDAPLFSVETILSDLTVTNTGESKTVKFATRSIDESNVLLLNGKKVTVDGNLELLKGVTLNVAKSVLNVKGNFNAGSKDEMINSKLEVDEASVINVDGDFYWNSNGGLMEGVYSGETDAVLNLKGNLTIDSQSDFKSKLNMLASTGKIQTNGKIKEIVLSGAKSDYDISAGCCENIQAVVKELSIAVKQKIDISKYYSDAGVIKKYQVSSMNGGKAKVTKKGVLTASKPGTIEVKPILASGDSDKIKPLTIVVTKPQFKSKSLKATYAGQTVSANEFLSDVPKGQDITWTLSGKKPIAIIDAKTGEITVKDTGKIKVVATIKGEGIAEVKLTATLTVKIPKLSVYDSISLASGKSKNITLKNVDKNTNVTWKSSDQNVVAIYPNGPKVKVSALSAGTATITATVDGKEYSTKITVN